MAALRINLLGGFDVRRGETAVPVPDAPRLHLLLAYLLLHRGVPQARPHLAFLFWPDSSEAQARTNLRKLIYRLRRQWPEVADSLQMDSHALTWQEEALIVSDVNEYMTLPIV